MARGEQQLLERLGSEGLARVLDDVLEGTKLVRLANACGLKYAGMRTSSQKRERIVRDLVERSSQAGARRTIVRQLAKELRPTAKEWGALDLPSQLARLQSVRAEGNGSLGRHLWLLAGEESEHSEQFTELLDEATRRAGDVDVAKSAAETRLERKLRTLTRKLRATEEQLGDMRESHKQVKKELIQRKGELAEARMANERLRKQLARLEQESKKAQAAATAKRKAAPRAAGAEDPEAPLGQLVAKTDRLTRALRKIGKEQTRIAEQLEKTTVSGDEAAKRATTAVKEPLRELKKELAAVKREQRKESDSLVGAVEELRGEIKGVRRAVARRTPPKAKTRVASEPRVGVFVDVQNVYYGARRLKGKLDFGALMEAAVLDRRLIQATAYVVESKETDQTNFIALLSNLGIEVRRKSLKVRADGSMKGDWDMELALDVLDAASQLDVVVLVSGDGDFTSLVQRVRKIGPRVELIGFPRNTAKSLIEAADSYQPLDRKFMIYPPRRNQPDAEPARS